MDTALIPSDPGYCRDCRAALAAPGACLVCGSHRQIRHPEINALSIAHIDCDAFFCSVEKRDNPELADKPVVVGGGRRGVVAAACYNARVYGVKSAMPMFKALKLCPHLTVIRGRHDVYAAEGRRIKEMMGDLTPAVQPLSIDEAFLDMTGTTRLHGAPPAKMLLDFQARVKAEVGVTVSVGLSYNKFLAKTASDLDKPHGFAVIGRAEAVAFLADKPVDFIFGVGPSFARSLNGAGIMTIGDITRRGESFMAKKFGEHGLRLSRLARGEDSRPVREDTERKSISAETTFSEDISDKDELLDKLWYVCQRASDHAKAKGFSGRVVTLKLKTDRFQSLTRRRTLAEPTQLADSLFRALEPLLDQEADGRAFRLIGAGLSGLEETAQDGTDWLDPQAQSRAKAERASDAARAKFGKDAVMKGRELKMRSRGMKSVPASRADKGDGKPALKSRGIKGAPKDPSEWKSRGMKSHNAAGAPRKPKGSDDA